MFEARRRDERAVIASCDRLLVWLRDQALPLWESYGVDRFGGGYFEEISTRLPLGRPVAVGVLRRGRVVARQIYVFDTGQKLGWRPAQSDPVAHGCEFLFAHLHAGDGVFHKALDASTHRPEGQFSLYEQSFYLFALAHLNVRADPYPIADTAERCLERLRAGWGKSIGGFEESDPPSLPLKSNPHMHLLEAALAWIESSRGVSQTPWIGLARELVGLCLTCFRDPASGAILEYFDYNWRKLGDGAGRIVEPGHQFEWAWLLLRWAASPFCPAREQTRCRAAARCLVDIGEQCGVDSARNVAVNELWDDMSIKEASAKIWPQTERLKAWCAIFDDARIRPEADAALRKIALAAEGLSRFLRADTPGLWFESCTAGGEFPEASCKASSLYHVVGAIDGLQHTARRLAS